LRDALPEIRRRGAELVVVGNGSPWHAKGFREEQGIDFPLYVDPDLAAYAAAGLKRGVLDTLRPAAIGKAVRAWRSGARQGKTQGDPWQLGGVFVVRAGGEVLYRHINRDAGDHPPAEPILGALDKL